MPAITIFCDDAEAVTAYQSIVEFASRETGFDNYEFIKIYADMTIPVFSCYLKLGSPGRPILLEEVANIVSKGDKTEIVMSSEQYVPQLLDHVLKTFGKDAIEQPDRMKVIIDGDVDDLASFIVHNPAARQNNLAFNFLNWIVPEAFKVRKMQVLGDSIFLVTSEDTIEDEWIQKSKEALL